MFETIALDEEGHWAWLDQQLGLLERMGEPAFMQVIFHRHCTRTRNARVRARP